MTTLQNIQTYFTFLVILPSLLIKVGVSTFESLSKFHTTPSAELNNTRLNSNSTCASIGGFLIPQKKISQIPLRGDKMGQ